MMGRGPSTFEDVTVCSRERVKIARVEHSRLLHVVSCDQKVLASSGQETSVCVFFGPSSVHSNLARAPMRRQMSEPQSIQMSLDPVKPQSGRRQLNTRESHVNEQTMWTT